MKQNRIEQSSGKGVLIALTAVVATALVVGLTIGYNRLHDIWLEQYVIEDANLQVAITSGKMVKADVLADEFGLKKDANLALIDFNTRRKEVLRKIPNLREINIVRHLPGKVTITIEERTPIARMGIRGRRSETGRVVDADGVVFIWQRGTQMLPVIREPQTPGTAVGQQLTGRALAALQLIKASQNAGHSELGLLEIAVAKQDYLIATLNNYAQVKIAWEGMDSVTPTSQAALDRQLDHLAKAIQSHVGDRALIWNATDTSKQGIIYADTKGNLR